MTTESYARAAHAQVIMAEIIAQADKDDRDAELGRELDASQARAHGVEGGRPYPTGRSPR